MVKKKIKKKQIRKKKNLLLFLGDKKQWLFYTFFGVLTALLPFIYYRNGLDPALNPRLLFLSVWLAIFTIILFFNLNQLNTSILRKWIFYLFFAYFAITSFSIIFAINAREGNFDINKTFATLTLIAVGSILLSNTPNWHKQLPLFFILPTLTLLSVGFWEYYNNIILPGDKVAMQNLPMIYEIRGLMAHKNQFAVAMMMLLPFIGFGIYKNKGIVRLIFVLLSVLLLVLIALIKTRSVWVGITISTTLVIILLVFFGNRLLINKRTRIAIGATVLIFTISFSTVIYFTETHNPDSMVYKIKNITNRYDYNNIHRMKIWDITEKMIKDYPLQGVGAGNWKINAPYYYPGYQLNKDQLNWLRPHNDYLWVLAEKGVFGLLAFLGIFAIAFIYLFKVFFSLATPDKKVLSVFLFAGLSGYLSVSFFTFPLERINQQVYLAVLIAASTTLYHQELGKTTKTVGIKILGLATLIMLSYSILYCTSVLKMETRVKQARILQERGRWQQMLELSKTIPATYRTIDAEAMPIAWYRGLSYANLNQTEKANLAYQEARKAHPTRIAVLNNLGQTYFKLGQYEQARNTFLEALAILPDYFEALVNLSSSYIQLRDYEKAYEYLQKIPNKKLNDPLKGNLKFVRTKLREQGKLPMKNQKK